MMMAGIRKMAEEGMLLKQTLLREYYDDVFKCMRCGWCRGLCPVQDFVNREANAPRGKIQILRALFEGDLPNISNYAIERLYFCTTCAYCLWRCPSGVKTTDIIEAARATLVNLGYATPPAHKRILENIREVRNPFGEPREKRAEWLPTDVKLSERAPTLYWAGCMASYRVTDTAVTTTKVLEASGVDFTILGPGEGECGSVLIRTGHWGTVKELAQENKRLFKDIGAKTLVTSCAGCYRTFSHDYPMKFGVDLHKELGIKILHSSQFFEHLIRERKLKPKELKLTVAYHDPCHLGRHLGVYDSPRNVLKAIPGITLKEIPSRNRFLASCCGAGGGFRSAFPELSIKQAARRIEQAQQAKIDALVTACPFCVENFKEGMKQIEKPVPVYDLPELLAKSLKLNPPPR